MINSHHLHAYLKEYSNEVLPCNLYFHFTHETANITVQRRHNSRWQSYKAMQVYCSCAHGNVAILPRTLSRISMRRDTQNYCIMNTSACYFNKDLCIFYFLNYLVFSHFHYSYKTTLNLNGSNKKNSQGFD